MYYEKNKVEIQRKERERYAKNRERCREVARKWVENNKERKVQADREWKKKNAEKVRLYYQQYREKNREKIRGMLKDWAAKNPDKVRKHHAIRKAQKHKTSHEEAGWICAWEKRWKAMYQVRCYWCLHSFHPSQCHPDHIIPLSRRGGHTLLNLCIACIPRNMHKRAKSLKEWNKLIEQPVLF